jgi:hypothetical protein
VPGKILRGIATVAWTHRQDVFELLKRARPYVITAFREISLENGISIKVRTTAVVAPAVLVVAVAWVVAVNRA